MCSGSEKCPWILKFLDKEGILIQNSLVISWLQIGKTIVSQGDNVPHSQRETAWESQGCKLGFPVSLPSMWTVCSEEIRQVSKSLLWFLLFLCTSAVSGKYLCFAAFMYSTDNLGTHTYLAVSAKPLFPPILHLPCSSIMNFPSLGIHKYPLPYRLFDL